MAFVLSGVIAGYINKFANKYLESVGGSHIKFDFRKQKGQIDNVFLRPEALKDLNLPVQVKAGHLGSLHIDFPLTNIWSGKWKLYISDVNLLIEPSKIYENVSENFDEEQLKKKLKEIKLKETIAIQNNDDSTLTERLFAKVLENLDITIRDLHIRYEDTYTIEDQPFTIGLSLNEIRLSSASVDLEKLRSLEGLCRKVGEIKKFVVYLDSNSSPDKLFSRKISREEILAEFKLWNQRVDHGPSCIVGPVSCTTEVILCMKPWKNDWLQPKFVIDLIITELKAGICKSQFQTAYLLAQMYDIWSKGVPYLHLHPGIQKFKGETRNKERWKFAINCIRHDVHKKNVVWSWIEHFEPNRRHRIAYRNAYEKELRNDRLSEEEIQRMRDAERFLNAWNLLQIRKLARNTVEAEKKAKSQASSWSVGSWLFGWKSQTEEEEQESAVDDIRKALGSEEEQKALREALDLSEDTHGQYPKRFVELKTKFVVQRLGLVLTNDNLKMNVFEMKVEDMEFGFSSRPSADSIRVTTSLNNFQITNGNPKQLQTLVERHAGSSGLLLSADYETKPDGALSCDQKLTLKALPLDIYVSWTILNEVQEIFTPPNADEFVQLKVQAEQAVGAVQQSLAALEYTKKNKEMKISLDVHMQGSYLILPETGIYVEGLSSCLVANLGTLTMKSVENEAWDKFEHRKQDIKDPGEEARKLIEASYDIYKLEIKDIQIVSVLEDECWAEQLEQHSSSLLGKTSIELEVRLTALKDVRAPKLLVNATLPPLVINLVDKRLAEALKVVNAISPPLSEKDRKRKRRREKRERKRRAQHTKLEKSELEQKQRFLEGNFNLSSLTLEISHFAGFQNQPIARLQVTDVRLKTKMLEDESQFHFTIGAVRVTDSRNISTAYRTIVSQLDGEKTVDIFLQMFSLKEEELSDVSKHHMYLKFTGASLQFVYLNRFIQDIQSFFSHLSMSKKTAMAVSQSATEQTVANLQQIFETRVKLDVYINAPVVIIPRTSTDTFALVLDFGKLTLNNYFQSSPKDGLIAVSDNIEAKLEDFKFSIGSCKDERLVSECYLIAPTTFQTDIVRSISEWNKSDPEISVKARLTQISVSLCEADFPTFLETLSKNMSETGMMGEMEERISGGGDGSSIVSDWSTSSEMTATSIDFERTKIEANIIFDGFRLELYSGCTLLSEGVAKRASDQSFAVLQVLQIENKFSLRNDSSMSFESKLQGLKMTDSRADVDIRHRNLIQTKSTQGGKGEELMIIKGERDAQGNLEISGVFAGIEILFCLPYYLKLLPYIVVEDEESKAFVPEVSAPSGLKTMQGSSSMHIIFTMKDFQVLLVESLSDEKAYAVVAKLEADFQYLNSDPLSDMRFGIGRMEVFTCPVNPDERESRTGTLLYPAKCELSYSNSPDQSEVKVNIQPLTGPNLVVNIAPGTVDLIQRALSVVLTGSEESDEERQWKDLSCLFTPQRASKEDFYEFLSIDPAREADEYFTPSPDLSPETESPSIKVEELTISPFKLQVDVDAGMSVGPLLRLNLAIISGGLRNWSTKLTSKVQMSLELLYFSSKSSWMIRGIEPLPEQYDNRMIEVPFRFEIETLRAPSGKKSKLPEWTFTIKAKEQMELTVTKSFFDILTILGSAFGEKEKKQLTTSGHHWELKLINNYNENIRIITKDSGFWDPFLPIGNDISMYPGSERILSSRPNTPRKLKLCLRGEIHIVSISTNSMRCLPGIEGQSELVIDVKSTDGDSMVTFRSKLQLFNHTKRAVHVYTISKTGRTLEPCGTVTHCGVFNMPSDKLSSGSIYFVPKGDFSHAEFNWKSKSLENQPRPETIEFSSRKQREPLFFKVFAENITMLCSDGTKVINTTLHICPTLMLVNQLPVDIKVSLIGSCVNYQAKPGESIVLEGFNSPTLLSLVTSHLQTEYLCQKSTAALLKDDISEVPLDFESDYQTSFRLFSITKLQEKTPHVFLHSKFWFVNSTGLPLECKNDVGEEILLPDSQIAMFYPKEVARGSFRFGLHGLWSDSYRLDAPGSEVPVRIRHGEAVYLIAATVSMASAGMTFKVILTPGIQFVNSTRFPLMYEFVEEREGLMDDKCLLPQQTKGVWPHNPETAKVIIRPHGCLNPVAPIPLAPAFSTLIKLKGEIGAVFVEYLTTNATTSLFISPYSPGLAPWEVFNLHSEPLVYGQKDHSMHILGSYQKALYTWENPLSAHVLIIKKDEKLIEIGLTLIETIQSYTSSSFETIYWLTFVLNQQRCVVVTDDEELLVSISQINKFGNPQMKIRLELDGLALSIVDEENRKEISYINLYRPIPWQFKRKDRFVNFSQDESVILENSFSLGRKTKQIILKKFGETMVDFEGMKLTKSDTEIRRAYDFGVFTELTFFDHGLRECSFSAAALQIDNHLEGCMYPVVLLQVPQQTEYGSAKPFVEIVYVDRVQPNRAPSDIILQTSIQDFMLFLELPFLIELFNFTSKGVEPEIKRESLRIENIHKDMALKSHLQPSRTGERSFIRRIYTSPVNVQISFSLSNVQGEIPEFIAFFLRTVNVASFSEANFSFSSFEIENTAESSQQIMNALQSHYTIEGLQQVYKVALGLDILGNPLKLVSEFSTGVISFMSEPLMGAFKGSDEFAEGIITGTRSLFRGTVGGVASAVGKVAGVIGSGATAMTLDRRRQQERREQKLSRNAGQTGLPAMAGNFGNFFESVSGGITGVVTQPVTGARKEGALGFFKGVGKGMAGLVARPIAAVADLAADTLKTVETATGSTVKMKRRRLTRYIPVQGPEPYVQWKAEGAGILKNVGALENEDYKGHAIDSQNNMLMITSSRILYLRNKQILWFKDVSNLKKVTTIGIQLVLNFDDRSQEEFFFGNEQMSIWIEEKINEVMQ
ncbi:hypothetical protein QYM36_003337 [Artemia franciscana]|uniref:Uncharacterized protein n=2 Tax=Artemia franciscana TaxID=6661 RepID=A0AA88I9T2_ARTSF|nr:hypothetical protein QYM36_003337 [Artemia franciscana]